MLRGLRRQKLVALTFDDGPDEKTEEIVTFLAAHKASATFFVLGRQVEGREKVLRLLLESGHEIGNHTFNHPHLESLEAAEIEHELSRTSDLIEDVVGIRPRLMRPPYGRDALRAAPIARRLGMKTVLWSVNPKDWAKTDPAQITDVILAGAAPGAVVVLHDGAAHTGDRSPTLAALRTAVPRLRDEGYSLVTVSTLLEKAPWTARSFIPRRRGALRRLVASRRHASQR